MIQQLRGVLVPIHREGYPYIAAFALGAFLLGLLWEPLGWIGAVLTLWCIYFFRDPDRVTPVRQGLVVSPADGHVCLITTCPPPEALAMPAGMYTRVSVFMNVFDCHVNRAPVDGVIGKTHYVPGKFINAALDKASEDNERQLLRFDLPDGRAVGCVQIAGLVARRIVLWAEEGQTYQTGQRFGLIRFGSRVDVYLPEGVAPLVTLGQTMVAGETVLADLTSSEPARSGMVR